MITKAEKLTVSIFQLEQELNRGTWTDKEEEEKLLNFAKDFNENVKRNEKLLQKVNEVENDGSR